MPFNPGDSLGPLDDLDRRWQPDVFHTLSVTIDFPVISKLYSFNLSFACVQLMAREGLQSRVSEKELLWRDVVASSSLEAIRALHEGVYIDYPSAQNSG